MGQSSLYTYVRPFLEIVTHVDDATLSLIFLGIGVAGFSGTTLIGSFLDANSYRTLLVMPLIMAVLAVMLILFGHSLTLTAVLLCAWGLIATAAPVGWWTWVTKTMPDNTEIGGGLLVAFMQLSTGLGATVGGV